jgi:elongation factor G
MSKYLLEDVRNIALAGHGASGKTSLADALLFAAKAVDRRGSVDDGTSVSDYDEEEHKRRFSIDTSVLHFEHRGRNRRHRRVGGERRAGQHPAHVR